MTLVIQKPTTSKLVMRKGWQPMDSDAATYIAAVEAADGQALEEKTKIAIDNFVLGCKADGIWSAIKASCILAGARTLSGALVPLVGAAPTNNNFVADDYNRKTGLKGNGSSKYLDSNFSDTSVAQNNISLSAFQTVASSGSKGYIGARVMSPSIKTVQLNANSAAPPIVTGSIRSSFTYSGGTDPATGPVSTASFIGGTRSASSTFTIRANNRNNSVLENSVSGNGLNFFVFAFNQAGSAFVFGDARLAFYHVGESLDLALLDARVTDLINAIGAAF